MIGNKKILTVVTARAGSKGIPGKNVMDLMGRPLFMWSMLASIESKYVDTTILSSNCDKCIEICNKYLKENREKDKSFGWILRPDEISGDLSKNEEALIHALECYRGGKYDVVINLQPTSPCRLGGLLDRCIEAYHEGGYDSLLTGRKLTPFLWKKKDGKWVYPVDRHNCCDRKMRQEFLDDDKNSDFLWHDDGSVYITESKILLDTKCRIGYNPCVFENTGINTEQIDEKYDFDFIQKMLETMSLERPI